jgi:hypothetical protein
MQRFGQTEFPKQEQVEQHKLNIFKRHIAKMVKALFFVKFHISY